MLGKINMNKIYKKGDKIGQLVAEQTNPITFKLVDDLTQTERGTGGFGSTGIASNNFASSVDMPPNPINTKNNITERETNIIIDAYNKTGGIPVKKKYSDEMKERERR
jgi:hypothetical protein